MDKRSVVHSLKLMKIAVNVLIILKIIKNMKFRRWWVKPYLQRSLGDKYGAYTVLFTYFAIYDHESFVDFIHMNVENFIVLLELVKKKLRKTSIRTPIIPEMRLAITLHFLAHGGCAKNDAWHFRIGTSTMYAIIKEVCEVLSSVLIPKYLQFPNEEMWLKIADGFEADWNFPNCIGALDGKHICIQRPPHAGATFKNYKKFNSLVLLAVCDSKRRFTWFNVGDFGSLSDSSIFSTSDLSNKLQYNEANIPQPRLLEFSFRILLTYKSKRFGIVWMAFCEIDNKKKWLWVVNEGEVSGLATITNYTAYEYLDTFQKNILEQIRANVSSSVLCFIEEDKACLNNQLINKFYREEYLNRVVLPKNCKPFKAMKEVVDDFVFQYEDYKIKNNIMTDEEILNTWKNSAKKMDCFKTAKKFYSTLDRIYYEEAYRQFKDDLF